MNINEEIQIATQTYLESDKLKKHIQNKAEQMVNEIINDSFGYFGDIKHSVEKAVKEEVRINISELGLSGFNKFITEVIKDKLDASVRKEASDKIGAEIEKMLAPMEKVITVDKLKSMLFKDVGTYDLDVCGNPSLGELDELGYDENELFTFIIEEPLDPKKHNWRTIYLDREADKLPYDCEFEITVHEDFTKYRINHRDLSAKDKVFGYKNSIEDFIYAMFLNDSVIDLNDAKRYT